MATTPQLRVGRFISGDCARFTIHHLRIKCGTVRRLVGKDDRYRLQQYANDAIALLPRCTSMPY